MRQIERIHSYYFYYQNLIYAFLHVLARMLKIYFVFCVQKRIRAFRKTAMYKK